MPEEDQCDPDVQTSKYLLFAYNVLFTLMGLGVVIGGGIILTEVNLWGPFLEGGSLRDQCLVLVAMGLFTMGVAFLGWCGASKESILFLVAYAICAGIIFMGEMAAGVTAISSRGKFEAIMRDQMAISQKDYLTNPANMKAWDEVQQRFECCGVEEIKDWREHFADPVKAPLSCCKLPGSLSCSNETTDHNMYDEGCYITLKDRMKNRAVVLAAIGIGFALLKFGGVALAWCMITGIREGRY